MDDRTRVVLTDLAGSPPFAGGLLPWLLTHRDELDPRSVLVGAISGFAIGYASEHDPVASKLERYRNRLVQSTVLHLYQRLCYRYLPSRESFSASCSTFPRVAVESSRSSIAGGDRSATRHDRYRRSNDPVDRSRVTLRSRDYPFALAGR